MKIRVEAETIEEQPFSQSFAPFSSVHFTQHSIARWRVILATSLVVFCGGCLVFSTFLALLFFQLFRGEYWLGALAWAALGQVIVLLLTPLRNLLVWLPLLMFYRYPLRLGARILGVRLSL